MHPHPFQHLLDYSSCEKVAQNPAVLATYVGCRISYKTLAIRLFYFYCNLAWLQSRTREPQWLIIKGFKLVFLKIPNYTNSVTFCGIVLQKNLQCNIRTLFYYCYIKNDKKLEIQKVNRD